MIDLKSKFATAELRQKYQDAGMFTEDDGPDIGDFNEVANVIKDVAAKDGVHPMSMILEIICVPVECGFKRWRIERNQLNL